FFTTPSPVPTYSILLYFQASPTNPPKSKWFPSSLSPSSSSPPPSPQSPLLVEKDMATTSKSRIRVSAARNRSRRFSAATMPEMPRLLVPTLVFWTEWLSSVTLFQSMCLPCMLSPVPASAALRVLAVPASRARMVSSTSLLGALLLPATKEDSNV
ncbi:unnamed protein product, partial [Tuber aestivum]